MKPMTFSPKFTLTVIIRFQSLQQVFFCLYALQLASMHHVSCLSKTKLSFHKLKMTIHASVMEYKHRCQLYSSPVYCRPFTCIGYTNLIPLQARSPRGNISGIKTIVIGGTGIQTVSYRYLVFYENKTKSMDFPKSQSQTVRVDNNILIIHFMN